MIEVIQATLIAAAACFLMLALLAGVRSSPPETHRGRPPCGTRPGEREPSGEPPPRDWNRLLRSPRP